MMMKVSGSIAIMFIGNILQQLPAILGDILILETIGQLVYLIGWLMLLAVLYMGRQKIAQKYNIQFGPWPDFFLICCCDPCALVQEFKVVEQGGGGPVGAPVAVGKESA